MTDKTFFEFTIEVGGLDMDEVDLLYEAGADDGLICCRGERVFVDYCRESSSFETAVSSAIDEIEMLDAWAISVVPITDAGSAPPEPEEDLIRRISNGIGDLIGGLSVAGRKFLDRVSSK